MVVVAVLAKGTIVFADVIVVPYPFAAVVAEASVFVKAVLAHNRAAEVVGCVVIKLTAAEIAG